MSRSGGGRSRGRVEFPSTDSVLSELYNTGTPRADTSSTDDIPVSNTPPPLDREVSAASQTPVRDAADTSASGGNRTPEGMTRHTLYIARETAELLDAAAARLQSELGGLVPKHRILTALITAGVGQANAVADELKAALLRELTGGT